MRSINYEHHRRSADQKRHPGLARLFDAFVRALLAQARSNRSTPADKIARKLWPRDEQTLAVIKAASAPATTSQAGWASPLANTVNANTLLTTGPASAGGDLLRAGTVLSFGTAAVINVPALTAVGSDFSFVLQGNPIPVRQLAIANGAQLTPKKMAAAFAATRCELVEHSTPNAEQLLRQLMSATVSAGLDNVLLDATAASATRPAGLRNGVAAITASVGGGDQAMMSDLSKLVAAVSGVGGMDIAFVANPGEAGKLALRSGSEFKFPVFASSALAAGVVMAVALPALVSAIDPAVRDQVGRACADAFRRYHSACDWYCGLSGDCSGSGPEYVAS